MLARRGCVKTFRRSDAMILRGQVNVRRNGRVEKMSRCVGTRRV